MAQHQPRRKVVVTGLGVVTALGQTVGELWASLLAGRSGISRVTSFDATDFPSRIGGEIRDFDATKFMDPKEARRNDRYTQLALAAAKLAVEDAGMDVTKVARERAGVIIGSGIGGMSTFEAQARNIIEKGPRQVSHPEEVGAALNPVPRAMGLMLGEVGASAGHHERKQVRGVRDTG